MTGGLRGTASLMAIAALTCVMGATVFVAKPAKAADLGGDCCADLEERVADLEATTVRKGNKVSVQICGKVNYAAMWWDDRGEQNLYVVNNDNESTRTGIKGKAKIAGSLLQLFGPVQLFSTPQRRRIFLTRFERAFGRFQRPMGLVRGRRLGRGSVLQEFVFSLGRRLRRFRGRSVAVHRQRRL